MRLRPHAFLGVALLVIAAATAARVLHDRSSHSLRSGVASHALNDPGSLPAEAPVSAARSVVIHKADRMLGLYVDGKLSAAYRIALGRSPEGPKQREGDGRTPEGEYYICARNPHSRFHLFLGISYPNAEDAERAFRDKLISAEEHTAIREAAAARRQPPWDTRLGGEIGLHGSGAKADWTLGCVALEDEVIEALWEVLRLGDPVIISP
jgi:murein L,D-transpeptidase YafK